MIELRNINLDNVSTYQQYEKIEEEEKELMEALQGYIVERNKTNKEHVIEEYLDYMQACLGILQKHDITAEEIMEYYPKHLEKIKNRPREKQWIDQI